MQCGQKGTAVFRMWTKRDCGKV